MSVLDFIWDGTDEDAKLIILEIEAVGLTAHHRKTFTTASKDEKRKMWAEEPAITINTPDGPIWFLKGERVQFDGAGTWTIDVRRRIL